MKKIGPCVDKPHPLSPKCLYTYSSVINAGLLLFTNIKSIEKWKSLLSTVPKLLWYLTKLLNGKW